MPVNTIAPILAPLRTSQGTFYSFSSSINDSALLFSSENVRMSFSKFVCLKLPKWANQTEQRLFRDAADVGNPLNSDPNTLFVKAYLQNYIENLQQYTEANRTDNSYANSAEVAFWKSLRYVSDTEPASSPATGALQLETDTTYVKPDSSIGQKYVERPNDESLGESYERLIQYIGDINMTNHVRSGGQEYMEIYCHVPQDIGQSITPKFKPNDNLVFQYGQLPNGGGPNWIVGREDEYNAGTNSVQAIYDNQLNQIYDVSSDIEKLTVDFEEFENRTNDSLRHSKTNFEFNAILLYYDIWNKNDETTKKRNFYGMLILDDFETNGTSIIPSIKKYAPNEVSPGNSFAFRQNLKWSNYSNQVTSEITIGNELVGLDLYMDALARLTALTDEYSKISDNVLKQQQDIAQLKQIILQLNI